jgi:hypothetical protein
MSPEEVRLWNLENIVKASSCRPAALLAFLDSLPTASRERFGKVCGVLPNLIKDVEEQSVNLSGFSILVWMASGDLVSEIELDCQGSLDIRARGTICYIVHGEIKLGARSHAGGQLNRALKVSALAVAFAFPEVERVMLQGHIHMLEREAAAATVRSRRTLSCLSAAARFHVT